MGLLNRPSDGLPSVGVAVGRLLADHGPRSAREVRLLCDPEGLNRNQDSKVVQVLNRWSQLGIFTEDGGQVALGNHPEARQFFSREDPLLELFRWFVLQRVLGSVSSPLEDSPAGDFLIAAWWLMQVDPARTRLDSDSAAIRAAADFCPGRTVIQNDTRWQGLLEWIQFLGLGSVLKGRLLPNPTSAVRWALGEPGLEQGVPIAADDFMRHLIKEIPLFGNGTAAKAAAAYLRPGQSLETSGRRVSPGLSLGLLSLEAQGVLRLVGREDSQRMIIVQRLDGTERRVESVTVLGSR